MFSVLSKAHVDVRLAPAAGVTGGHSVFCAQLDKQ